MKIKIQFKEFDEPKKIKSPKDTELWLVRHWEDWTSTYAPFNVAIIKWPNGTELTIMGSK